MHHRSPGYERRQFRAAGRGSYKAVCKSRNTQCNKRPAVGCLRLTAYAAKQSREYKERLPSANELLRYGASSDTRCRAKSQQVRRQNFQILLEGRQREPAHLLLLLIGREFQCLRVRAGAGRMQARQRPLNRVRAP